MKPHQPLTWHLLPPAAGKLQDHVASGHGEKPQVALGGFAPHLRIEHFDWSFIDLQVAASLHLTPHGVVERTQPAGDMPTHCTICCRGISTAWRSWKIRSSA